MIPWTVAYQAPPSMGFSRQECWSGLPFPSPGDLPNPGIKPGSPTLQADALPSEPPGNEDNGDLQKVLCMHCHTQHSRRYSRPLPTHTSTGDSWTLTGKSRSVSCGLNVPFSWVLVHTRFCLCPPSLVSPVLCKFCNQIPLASKVKFPGSSQSLCQIPRLENLL